MLQNEIILVSPSTVFIENVHIVFTEPAPAYAGGYTLGLSNINFINHICPLNPLEGGIKGKNTDLLNYSVSPPL